LPTNSHPITDFFVKKTGSAIIVWWCGKLISIVRKRGPRFAIDSPKASHVMLWVYNNVVRPVAKHVKALVLNILAPGFKILQFIYWPWNDIL
jgi:hypothetical protein